MILAAGAEFSRHFASKSAAATVTTAIATAAATTTTTTTAATTARGAAGDADRDGERRRSEPGHDQHSSVAGGRRPDPAARLHSARHANARPIRLQPDRTIGYVEARLTELFQAAVSLVGT